jgi:hypothetical protein
MATWRRECCRSGVEIHESAHNRARTSPALTRSNWPTWVVRAEGWVAVGMRAAVRVGTTRAGERAVAVRVGVRAADVEERERDGAVRAELLHEIAQVDV